MGLPKTLVKIAGIGLIVVGIIFSAIGVYGLAGGTRIAFTINERLVTAQEGGQLFSIIGIIILIIGIVLTYVGFKRME